MSFVERRKVVNIPGGNANAITNCVFCNGVDPLSNQKYVEIRGFVFRVLTLNEGILTGQIGMNGLQRKIAGANLNDEVEVYNAVAAPAAELVTIRITPTKSSLQKMEVDAALVLDRIKQLFVHQVFSSNPRQQVFCDCAQTIWTLEVTGIILPGGGSADKGTVVEATEFSIESANPLLRVTGTGSNQFRSIFKESEMDFEKLGVGGVDVQFREIFRRAFLSRSLPPSLAVKLGIRHVKGMLLYGPPGTGKTLIARQIGKLLNARPPKICNGPEVLSKYVGQSEENIRKLFEDAEKDQAENGDNADLHVIIFDEIDAICKQRGSARDSTGVHDTIVNQLLTKIDGVDSLNNILLIGMTNRKDMLDEALLRPGRLEIQIEVALPDEEGRVQILTIHTKKMKDGGFLGDDVDLPRLAAEMKNYTGAEIEGVVTSARSYALSRHISLDNMTNLNYKQLEEQMKVYMQDFGMAMDEIKPAFGVQADDLKKYFEDGMVDYGPRYQSIVSACEKRIKQLQVAEKAQLQSVLLLGPAGVGKTAIASFVAVSSGVPLIKVITAKEFAGLADVSRCNYLLKAFNDATKSTMSVVVLDQIELLLGYAPVGPRFSAPVLETILQQLNTKLEDNHKMLIIGTMRSRDVATALDIDQYFQKLIDVAPLDHAEMEIVLTEAKAFPQNQMDAALTLLPDRVPVRALLNTVDLARSQLSEHDRKGYIPMHVWRDAVSSADFQSAQI